MVLKTFYPQYRGSFLPDDPWEGRVQSVYSKAVNLLHPDGILISFVDSIEQMTDYGIVISDFESLLSIISTGTSISFNGTSFSSPNLTVNLSQAKVWNGQCVQLLKESTFDISPIKRAFLKVALEDGLAPIITGMDPNVFSIASGDIIAKAFSRADINNGLLMDLSPLVGLGIGFTPSGDDFITGVMLYETLRGISIINKNKIKSCLSKTTAGSRTLLTLALKNSFPYYLKQYAELVSTANFSPDAVVGRAVMHGSTSGSDALSGFIWAEERSRKLQP